MSGTAGPDGVPETTERLLRIIAAAMGGGLTLMAGLVAWTYANSAAAAPSPEAVKSINLLTTLAMVGAMGAIVASEILWRTLLRKTPGPLASRVYVAYLVRLALREGAGLIGLTVAYLAASNGVLRAYPAYWVNAAPFGLFLGYLAVYWPSADALEAQARAVAGPL